MSTLAKIFLSIFFFPVFLILLASVSTRFQLLSPDFWIKTYEKHDVYQKLNVALPKALEAQSEKEGGSKEETAAIKEMASFLKEDNLKITVEKNIRYSLDYFNGIAGNWIVYLPSEPLPKELLPNFLISGNEVSMTALVSFFSRSEDENVEIPLWIPFIGRSAWVSLGIIAFVFLVFAIVLIAIKALHIALITSGLLTLLIVSGTNLSLSAIEIEWAKETEPSQIILGALGIPLAREVLTLWLYIAIGTIVVGIIFAFLSKRGVK